MQVFGIIEKVYVPQSSLEDVESENIQRLGGGKSLCHLCRFPFFSFVHVHDNTVTMRGYWSLNKYSEIKAEAVN